MNERIRQLMLDAGYAAPDLASRAKALADLVINECIIVARIADNEDKVYAWYAIEQHFGINK